VEEAWSLSLSPGHGSLSSRPLSALPSPAAAAVAALGASGGPGPSWGPRSHPTPSRSGGSHTADLCSLRDSCSGRC